MAIETATLVVDEAWTLVSNATTGAFRGFAPKGGVVWFVGDTAPTTRGAFGFAQNTLSYETQPAKVYARATSGSAPITVGRVVDAANSAELFIPSPAGTVSGTTTTTSALPGSTVATITPGLSGSKAVSLSPANAGLTISDDGLSVVRTREAIRAGNLPTTIMMAHPKAANSPKGFDVQFSVSSPTDDVLPSISPVTGAIVNSASASQVVLDLPALVAGESRSYIPTTGPAFAVNSSGDLIRGMDAWASAGTATGKVRQTRNGVNTDTSVTITLSVATPVTTTVSRRVALPADFDWTPPFNISQRYDGAYGHDVNVDALKPTTSVTVYCGLTGDNSKDGLSPANKVRSLSLAVAKVNSAGSGGQFVRLVIDPDYFLLSSVNATYADSFAGITITANVVIESSMPGRGVYSISDRAVPAFAATATDATVYVSALGSVTVGQCAIDMARLDKNGMFPGLRRCFPAATDEATIVAAINAKAAAHGEGAFFLDTTAKKFYVKLAAGRAPDTGLVVMSDTAANLQWQPALGAARTIWISPDIKICGGNNPVRFVSNTTAGTDLKVYVKGSTSAYSGTGHGFSFSGGPGYFVLDRPEALYCAQDGINYNGVASSGSWKGLEANARTYVTGLNNDGDGSNNGSSAHLDCRIIRANCVYEEGTNRAVHDIQNAQSLNFGLDVRANRTAGNGQVWDASYCAGLSGLAGATKMYLYGCKSAAAQSYDIEAYDGGQAFYADMAAGDTNVSGTGAAVTAFTPQFATFTAPSDAVILDPSAGKTLAANWGDAVDGKVLVLKAGNHGKPAITRANTIGVTVYSEAGAYCEKLDFSGSAAKWNFLDAKVMSEGIGGSLNPQIICPETGVNSTYPTTASKYLISIGLGTSYITFDGLQASATDDTSAWVEKDWAYRPLLVAVDISGNFCAVRNSRIYNCRRAINIIGSDALVQNNVIEEYGADGIDWKSNRVRILDNIVRNSRRYDTEPLHTDGIQGYGADGSSDVWEDHEISGNTIIEGPFQTGIGLNNMQGISIFDGIFKGIRVKDNDISVNSFHGLTLKGVDNVDIVRNRLTKYSSANTNTPWCLISLSKNGGGQRAPGKTKIAGNTLSDLKVFQAGVWVWVFAEGTGAVAGQTTIAISAPPGGTPVATGTPNIRTSGNVGGISGVTMGERAIDIYDPAPATPPTVTVTGPGTGHDLRATVVPTSYFKDAKGVVQIQNNKKLNGTEWGVPYSTL